MLVVLQSMLGFFKLRQDHTDPVGTDEPSTDWLPPDGEQVTAVGAAGHRGHKLTSPEKNKTEKNGNTRRLNEGRVITGVASVSVSFSLLARDKN